MISWLKSKFKIKSLDDRITNLEQKNAKQQQIIANITQELMKKDKQVQFLYAFSKKLEKRNEELCVEVDNIHQTIKTMQEKQNLSNATVHSTSENLNKPTVKEDELSLMLVEDDNFKMSLETPEEITIDDEFELQEPLVEEVIQFKEEESPTKKMSHKVVLSEFVIPDQELADIALDEKPSATKKHTEENLSKVKSKPLSQVSFVALDVETANRDRASICSMGLIDVEGGKIVRREQFLIRPKKLEFEPINVMIHGITASDVKDQLRFDELWPVIRNFIGDKIIVAHNASFDMSAMKKVLQQYHLPFAKLRYVCTKKLSKKLLPQLDNYKLKTIATHFDLELNHHEAISDANVCAEIALIFCQKTTANNIEELLKNCNVDEQYVEFDANIVETYAETDENTFHKTASQSNFTKDATANGSKNTAKNNAVYQMKLNDQEETTSFIYANNWEEWSVYVHEELAQVKSQSKAHKTRCIEIDNTQKTGVFSGRNDKLYEVTLSTCECFDFMRKQKPCKHMYNLAHHTGVISLLEPSAEESELIIMRSIQHSEDFMPGWGGWDKRVHNIPSQKKRQTQGKKQQKYLEGTTLKECSCDDYTHRNFPCKHIYALKLYNDQSL